MLKFFKKVFVCKDLSDERVKIFSTAGIKSGN